MQDEQIIDLYWKRSEEAIRETDKKYGNGIFCTARRTRRSASTIHG